MDEFAEAGYDRESFVDYVVAQLHKPGSLLAKANWYRERADKLEQWLDDAKRQLDEPDAVASRERRQARRRRDAAVRRLDESESQVVVLCDECAEPFDELDLEKLTIGGHQKPNCEMCHRAFRMPPEEPRAEQACHYWSHAIDKFLADKVEPLVALDSAGAKTVIDLLEKRPGPNDAMRKLFGDDEPPSR